VAVSTASSQQDQSPLISALLRQGEPEPWSWLTEAREQQLPPEGDWFVWLIMAGRGWGKTRTGAEWLAHQARTHAGAMYGVIGRTTEQCRETCIEGESGLLRALDLGITSKAYNRTTGEIKLPNDATIYAYSAENPESLRGPNLSGAWCDELAAWHYEETWTEGLMPALRIGKPRVVVTTTPKRTKLVRELASRDDGSVVITRGATFDNAANLSETALVELRRRYEGTRVGRQELYGELLEDVPGALWSSETIETTRAVLID
jgi:phage terminase large subunit-like protein